MKCESCGVDNDVLHSIYGKLICYKCYSRDYRGLNEK